MLELTVVFLAAAVLLVPICQRLGLGTVLGYLVAGAIIGPSGFHIVSDVHEIMHFAEFGVVLLLFLIGLELQPARLWRMRGQVFGSGGAQLVISGLVIAGIATALGSAPAQAAVIGLSLSMSSTAFATQILGEKRELGTPHGRAAFAILLFQDIAAIPLLAVVPLLGGGAASHSEAPSRQTSFVIAAIAVVGAIVIGRLVLRPLFRFVTAARNHELSVATALLVVVATAMLMERVGLSMALGSFLAGVLLADSEYRHELEANIEPFKGLFLGLFFISIGMSANLGLLLAEPVTVLGLALGLVALKGLILFALGLAARNSKIEAAGLAASISQGGEFAFVLLGAATAVGAISAGVVDLMVLVVTLSMVTTPVAFAVRDRVLARLASSAPQRDFDAIEVEGETPVIIAGFGRFGQVVARVLRLRRIAFTALDASAEHVDFVRRFGNEIHYGDASRLDLLRAARADLAKVFVLAIDDIEASMRTLEVVQQHFSHLRIVARARNRQHAYALYGKGVDIVIRENFAGSVDAARRTLEECGVPAAEAKHIVRRFSTYDEKRVFDLHVHRDDQKKLIESAKEYAAELERIFEEDARSSASAGR